MEERSGQEIGRRDFLKGAALVGGAAAIAGLSACTPQSTDAPLESPKTSEGQYAFEIPPEPIPEDKIVDTVEADVVVVGAGLAGTFAALAAVEEGASVIVVTKSSLPVTHGIGWSVFDAEVQRDSGSEFDLDIWTNFFTNAAYGYANQQYVESVIYNSGRAADMLYKYTKERGAAFGSIMTNAGATICMWNDETVTNGYSRVPAMVNKMTSLVQELGATYYFSSPAHQLEKEGNRVVSVIADTPDGFVRIKAAKGIILSTGDIGNNPQMVAKYAPFCQGLLNTYAPQDNTGDGHQMALWIGARMYTGPFSQAIHYDPSPLPEGDAPFSGSPYLAVNARGRRYQNEDVDYPMVANLNAQQPEKLRWQIIDGTLTEYWNDFLPGMCRNAGFQFNSMEEGLEACLANGAIMKADTLEELADNIGFKGEDRDTFFTTIERYNELAAKGKDDDFGKRADYLAKTTIKTPPFYSVKRSPGPLALLDGIYSTPYMEALDNDLNLIPGLYVTGNVVHSMFGCDYTLNPGGISCGHAISTGYIAGKSIIDKLPDYKSYYKPISGAGTPVYPANYAGFTGSAGSEG